MADGKGRPCESIQGRPNAFFIQLQVCIENIFRDRRALVITRNDSWRETWGERLDIKALKKERAKCLEKWDMTFLSL